MFHTFSKWPFLLFYDYFKQCNKVFSGNYDFAEKIYAFYKVKIALNGHFFKCRAAGVKNHNIDKITIDFRSGHVTTKYSA